MSPAAFRPLCAIFILACFLLSSVRAQETDTTGAQQLPEIAPREIEIRGELQLSFPTLERQPLRGFATPPAVPSVPSTHTAYTESYKQELDALPESLPAPEAVSQSVTTPRSPKQGLLEFGGGRYVSRFIKGRASFPVTDDQRLSVEADYQGTEGHSPFDGTDVSTPSDDIDARVQFESRHEAVTVLADVHGSAKQYTLYGRPAVVQNTAATAPQRTGTSGGTTLQLRTHGSVDSDLRLSYDQTQYATELDPTDDATTDFSEGRLEVDGSAQFDVAGTPTRLDVSGARSSFGGDEPSNSAYSLQGGGSVWVLNTDRTSVRAGARVLTFDAPVDPTVPDAPSATAEFIAPEGRAELTLSNGVTLYAQNTPHLQTRGLADLYATNPYAEHAPSLRPTLFTTDAEAGLSASLGAVRLQATGGYRYAPFYRFFTTPPGASAGVFRTDYESASILHGGAELALQGIAGVEASAGVSIRDGSLVGSDTAIPYFSPVVADAMLSVSFADQQGLLQTTGRIESPRPVDATESTEVDTYVSFDIEGSYQVTPLLDVVLRIQNIGPSAPERWARYPRPPANFMGGVRIHW